MKKSILLLLFLAFLMLGQSSPSFGAAPTAKPFSSPEDLTPMPEDWQQKGLAYPSALSSYELVVNFDQSEGPILKPVVDKWAKDNGIKAFVSSGTCGVSNRNLLHKEMDVGSFCCPPGKMDRLPGVAFHTLGLAPHAVAVNPANPLSDITFVDAQQVFAGRLTSWEKLSTAAGVTGFTNPIQPVIFPHCKQRPGHWRLLLESHEMLSSRAIEVTSIPDMIFTLSSNKRGIGIEVLSTINHYEKEKGKVKVLTLNGLHPNDLEAVAAGKYPLYRAHTLAFWVQPELQNKYTRKLIEFLDSYIEENSQKLGIVPTSVLKKKGWQFHGEEVVEPPR